MYLYIYMLSRIYMSSFIHRSRIWHRFCCGFCKWPSSEAAYYNITSIFRSFYHKRTKTNYKKEFKLMFFYIYTRQSSSMHHSMMNSRRSTKHKRVSDTYLTIGRVEDVLVHQPTSLGDEPRRSILEVERQRRLVPNYLRAIVDWNKRRFAIPEARPGRPPHVR